MRNLSILALFTLALGCSGGGQDDTSFTCEQSDRSGTYFWEFTTVDGDCGDFGSGLAPMTDAPGCTTGRDAWSENNCKRDRDLVCEFADGYAVYTEVTEQQDAAGDVITGLETVTVRTADGSLLCYGTYRFTATRQ